MEDIIRACILPKAICNHTFHKICYPEIHIVDWKNFDGGRGRGIEICNGKPKEIDSVCLFNDYGIEVSIDAFGENALPYPTKREGYAEQCECVASPSSATADNWFLAIETKYTNNLNAALNHYPKKMITQIISTVDYLRAKGAVGCDKVVYAILSFPKLLSDFDGMLFTDNGEELDINKLIVEKKIWMKVCNSARIVSHKKITLT
jgi:hypothetical protein